MTVDVVVVAVAVSLIDRPDFSKLMHRYAIKKKFAY